MTFAKKGGENTLLYNKKQKFFGNIELEQAKLQMAKTEQQAKLQMAKTEQQTTTQKHQIINFFLSQQSKNKNLLLKEPTIQFLFEIPITKNFSNHNYKNVKKREVINQESLSFLSHRIYNGFETDNDGNIISAVNPPNYITYDMLLSEIGVFLDNKN